MIQRNTSGWKNFPRPMVSHGQWLLVDVCLLYFRRFYLNPDFRAWNIRIFSIWVHSDVASYLLVKHCFMQREIKLIKIT